MDFRYAWLDREAQERAELLQQLERLFHHLLLRLGGDAEEALAWLDRVARRHGLWRHGLDLDAFRRWLEARRRVEGGAGGLRLSRRGEQALAQESLEQLFSGLARDAAGEHALRAAGVGQERLPETRPWAFGDPLASLDAAGSLRNALRRNADELALREEDLEVWESEHLSSCASVLLLDLSHSMVLYGEDRITPAKRVALGLCELVRTRYPKDALHVVTFGDQAREVPPADLPYVRVGPFHTNTRAALQLAQDILRRKRQANRQILMVTDGKPSALTERDGSLYKNPFGLDRRIVAKTLEEAAACRRRGIPITTFMLTDDPLLVDFVDELTRVNRGRAYYSSPERLGSFLFVDYLRNRRRRLR